MSWKLRADWRKWAYPVTGLLMLGFVASACAEYKPLTREEQDKVDKAIDKGVAYLKHKQQRDGSWPLYLGQGHQLGQSALPAYALLESGVPPDDPAMRKAAEFVRANGLRSLGTYDLGLTALFLDRLGDPKDKPLIRTIAARLIAGQVLTGGWSYRCPLLTREQEDALLKALAEMEKRREEGEKSYAALIKGIKVPRGMGALPVLRNPRTLPWQPPPHGNDNAHERIPSTDNSNTQFALLGLWAAQRHGVPVKASFRLAVERFERSQTPVGMWGYNFVWWKPEPAIEEKSLQSPRFAAICVGLLGLAVGRGLKLDTPDAPRAGEMDVRIVKGLTALRWKLGDSIVAPVNGTGPGVLSALYDLWSLERVGMLYDLPTIGDKDWYRWGAGGLVLAQQPRGEWNLVYTPTIDTAFALLFLKRSHPMKDLTTKLPFTAKELNQGIARMRRGDGSPVRGGEPSDSSQGSRSNSTEPGGGKKPPR